MIYRRHTFAVWSKEIAVKILFNPSSTRFSEKLISHMRKFLIFYTISN